MLICSNLFLWRGSYILCFRLFPNANIITELNQASNMRFMHFRAHDEYSQKISGLERVSLYEFIEKLSNSLPLPLWFSVMDSADFEFGLVYLSFERVFCRRQKHYMSNSVDPDQTVPQEQSDLGLNCLQNHVSSPPAG